MQRVSRMKKEFQMFAESPPPGISCWPKNDSDNGDDIIYELEASILGPHGTPYENGVFKLFISIPERYPFEPPTVLFVTPIYHPNVDNGGRICLNILKMPPEGSWKPVLNLTTVLISIQLLLSEPNPDDPLLADLGNEYKYNKGLFVKKAAEYTRQHAISN